MLAFQDVNFHGYFIPAETVILMNLHSVHYDPAVFSNPYEFQPGRFLNAKGEFDGSIAEKVIPFGYGKRKCVGENGSSSFTDICMTGKSLFIFIYLFPKLANPIWKPYLFSSFFDI